MALTRYLLLARALIRLHPSDLARVGWHRARLRLGLHPVQALKATEAEKGAYFLSVGREDPAMPMPVSAWSDKTLAFGWHERALGDGPPNFLSDCLTGLPTQAADRPWWNAEDDIEIKRIWEFSRFDWALAFAQRARLGHQESLNRLNLWLSLWTDQNPAYLGPNWRCGQEASLRVLHLVVCAVMLQEDERPTPAFLSFVQTHLRRIAPTISYAIGQANNHAISEAAALFVGGTFLAANGDRSAEQWAISGRRWLEACVARLFFADGGFSLGSVNYHRTVLDTLSIVEMWRVRRGYEAFSKSYYRRVKLGINWLYEMVDASSGDAPNIGPNDGGRLIRLVETPLRDFRPSLTLAAALFLDEDASEGVCSAAAPLKWLGLAMPEEKRAPRVGLYAPQSGFSIGRYEGWMVVLRYPQARFRPGQADGLHLDVWHHGLNILRDAGTFSYLLDADTDREFSGTFGHNVVRFDGREPMPKASQFLYADWQKTTSSDPPLSTPQRLQIAASLRNKDRSAHTRTVTVSKQGVEVSDKLSGFKKCAVLRWRLMPGQWTVDGLEVQGPGYRLSISSTVPIVRAAILNGWESRHYLHKSPVPVLEVEIEQPGTITSQFIAASP